MIGKKLSIYGTGKRGTASAVFLFFLATIKNNRKVIPYDYIKRCSASQSKETEIREER